MKEFCAKDLQKGWKETRLEEYTQKYDLAGGLHFFQKHPDARTNPVVFPPRYSRLSYRRSTFRPPPPRSLLRRDDGFFPPPFPPLLGLLHGRPPSPRLGASKEWSSGRRHERVSLVSRSRSSSFVGSTPFAGATAGCTSLRLHLAAHARHSVPTRRARTHSTGGSTHVSRGAEPGPKEIGRVKEQEVSCSFATYAVFPG